MPIEPRESASRHGAPKWRWSAAALAVGTLLTSWSAAVGQLGGLQAPGPPLPVTFSPEQVYVVTAFEIRGSSYHASFDKAFLVRGDTPLGPTVLVVIGEGTVRLQPDAPTVAEVVMTEGGDVLSEKQVQLARSNDTVETIYIRLHPHDPLLAGLKGKPVPHSAAFEAAQRLHRAKFPASFFKRGLAVIPRKGIRTLDFECRELGRVVIVDAPPPDSMFMLVRQPADGSGVGGH
jgi:hypothetical protein